MQFVETHAHLDSSKFDQDLDAVFQRSLDAGVTQAITVGADLASSRAAVALAEQHPNLYATVGIHPHDAQAVSPAALDALNELALHPQVVAIGEIGLDYYRNYAPHEAQRLALTKQLALAARVAKPVVIHIRDQKGEGRAYDAVLAILRAWMSDGEPAVSLPSGVLHCYSGDLAVARAAIDLGFYLGVDGPVTYPNARSLQALVVQLPLDRILLETDCPYLPPQERRGQRNEPAYLPLVAEKVAQLKGLSIQAVARSTTANARRLFRLPEV